MLTHLNFLFYIFWGALESIAYFVLMFTVFKIRFRLFWYHIIFASIIIGYLGYTFRVIEDIASVAFLVQFLAFFLFTWLMFRVQVFFALFIAATTFITYGLIQLMVIFLGGVITNFQLSEIQSNFTLLYSLQFATIILVFTIARFMHKHRLGFNFVPHDDMSIVKLNKENIILLVIIILSICFVDVVYVIAFTNSNPSTAILLLIFTVVSVAILLYYAFKKEKDDEY